MGTEKFETILIEKDMNNLVNSFDEMKKAKEVVKSFYNIFIERKETIFRQILKQLDLEMDGDTGKRVTKIFQTGRPYYEEYYLYFNEPSRLFLFAIDINDGISINNKLKDGGDLDVSIHPKIVVNTSFKIDY